MILGVVSDIAAQLLRTDECEIKFDFNLQREKEMYAQHFSSNAFTKVSSLKCFSNLVWLNIVCRCHDILERPF